MWRARRNQEIPTPDISPLFSVADRPATAGYTDNACLGANARDGATTQGTRQGPLNSPPPMGFDSISFGSPHVRCTPMGRTCSAPNASKENTQTDAFAALVHALRHDGVRRGLGRAHPRRCYRLARARPGNVLRRPCKGAVGPRWKQYILSCKLPNQIGVFFVRTVVSPHVRCTTIGCIARLMPHRHAQPGLWQAHHH